MYFDPGTGSMLIQVLLGTLAIAGSVLFVVRNKIAKFFKKGQSEDVAADESEEIATPDNNEIRIIDVNDTDDKGE